MHDPFTIAQRLTEGCAPSADRVMAAQKLREMAHALRAAEEFLLDTQPRQATVNVINIIREALEKPTVTATCRGGTCSWGSAP